MEVRVALAEQTLAEERWAQAPALMAEPREPAASVVTLALSALQELKA